MVFIRKVPKRCEAFPQQSESGLPAVRQWWPFRRQAVEEALLVVEGREQIVGMGKFPRISDRPRRKREALVASAASLLQ